VELGSPPFTDDRPVTLRWLLSMRAGIDVPGFAGYALNAKLPSLLEILNGTPPANSPPVRVLDAVMGPTSEPEARQRWLSPDRMVKRGLWIHRPDPYASQQGDSHGLLCRN